VNKQQTDPSFGSDGFFLAGRAFADGLTTPQLFADDAVGDDKCCERRNVVDYKQQNCIPVNNNTVFSTPSNNQR